MGGGEWGISGYNRNGDDAVMLTRGGLVTSFFLYTVYGRVVLSRKERGLFFFFTFLFFFLSLGHAI